MNAIPHIRTRLPGLVNPNFPVSLPIELNSTGTSWACAGGWGVERTFSHTVNNGNNRILLVGVAGAAWVGDPLNTSSITYNGTPLTRWARICPDGLGNCDIESELWYLLSPEVGTFDIVITKNTDVNAAVGAISFKNVNQTTPFTDTLTIEGEEDEYEYSVSVQSTPEKVVFAVAAHYGWDVNSTNTDDELSVEDFWASHANNPSEFQVIGCHKPGANGATILTWDYNDGDIRNTAVCAVSLNRV